MAKTVIRLSQLDSSVATGTEVESDIIANLGVANGAAPLDENLMVPIRFLPTKDLTDFVDTLTMDGGTF